jgi:hypothetical protein
LGFALLLIDCMFLSALSFASVPHPDYPGSVVVLNASILLDCRRAGWIQGSRAISARFVHAMPAGSAAS